MYGPLKSLKHALVAAWDVGIRVYKALRMIELPAGGKLNQLQVLHIVQLNNEEPAAKPSSGS